jgi:hypothetical protein
MDNHAEMSAVPKSNYNYSVVRDFGGSGYADVALVRWSEPHGMLQHLLHRSPRDAVVLHHRTFRPMLQWVEMEAYVGQLQRAAEHGNNGTFGCFVQTEQREDGIVRISLYERWFDGRRLRCEQLAQRDFDAEEDDALVESAEFLTELQGWAANRNAEREASYLHAIEEQDVRAERASARAEAAKQLAQILASHNDGR